jgi:hypothetical protein
MLLHVSRTVPDGIGLKVENSTRPLSASESVIRRSPFTNSRYQPFVGTVVATAAIESGILSRSPSVRVVVFESSMT